MARFSRLEVLNAIVDIGLVPVFYHPDLETAKKIVEACAAGGARVIEFTNRGDFAPWVFKDLSEYVAKSNPNIILGVGSVVDAPTAALYIASGANFVVGPILNPKVARLCNRRKIAYCPGCGSASEISQAEELGVEIVKIFPGDCVG
ncbi:MAG: bifunctional 4-hydroxy-2-oxoglutarate aldolase/2-dehydro-3-deoxy-phosphogluconate aldolase, partial [Anaerolineae bacterium]|nr:bifunctional 4-hydroxy-2-oxoglutarate aldolase/2-dehydro-3-deoxy-phosphogluconate aldolase [Anaerolineae bacterium]